MTIWLRRWVARRTSFLIGFWLVYWLLWVWSVDDFIFTFYFLVSWCYFSLCLSDYSSILIVALLSIVILDIRSVPFVYSSRLTMALDWFAWFGLRSWFVVAFVTSFRSYWASFYSSASYIWASLVMRAFSSVYSLLFLFHCHWALIIA